ncbi:MAG: prepilin-type N-terminal cleavage/methylation domain-containing protein [Elusimicrobia bacterium]|nr:prepilin-type N-terminal cleavage/methylation domain-containing protein [Elusimicrobiota bacterium]
MKPTNRGVTLVELTIVSALVAVLAVFAGRILTGGTRTTVRWTLSADAMENPGGLNQIEFDLEEMTVVSSSTPVP